jgi:UDP:flavonoid glycosyltransferase YjiC (YdhE family)
MRDVDSVAKLRVLMVHWDGAGNQPPQRALARELIRRGHEVHVLSHDSVGERARSDGAIFHRLPTAHQYKDSDQIGDSQGELEFLSDVCWMASAYAHDFLAVASEVAPDLLLIDSTLASVFAAAADLGTPTVRVGHSIYAPERSAALLVGIVDPQRREMLQRAIAFTETLSLILVPSYAAFNPKPDLGPVVRHVGPIREAVETHPWPRRFPERPFVLVSLSTSFQDQAETLQRLCDALSSLEVEALVTTGPAMPPERFRAANHIELRSFAPHDQILPSTNLTITHSGHGTVMACAGAGVPMICMPMGRDQHFVASRVDALGLGRVLAYTAAPAEIAEAVSSLLTDPKCRATARDFAESVPRFGELRLAAMLVEQAAT